MDPEMGDQIQIELSNEMARLNADLLDQSLVKIRHCLDQLNEDQIWWRPEPSMNSIGNLLLHLAGNLKQWGVVPFTKAKDRRDRELEFDASHKASADELLEALQIIVDQAKDQWEHLTAAQLLRQVEIQGFDVSYQYAIIHTSSHFVGHTHQIIQLTRLQLRSTYRMQWTPNEPRSDGLPI